MRITLLAGVLLAASVTVGGMLALAPSQRPVVPAIELRGQANVAPTTTRQEHVRLHRGESGAPGREQAKPVRAGGDGPRRARPAREVRSGPAPAPAPAPLGAGGDDDDDDGDDDDGD